MEVVHFSAEGVCFEVFLDVVEVKEGASCAEGSDFVLCHLCSSRNGQ